MHYLIDGHNLIGKIHDISLDDPDDEVKLVLRLRSWTAQRRKRRVTVIFDGGIPGGKNVKLSTPSVKVVFASNGQTADALLKARIAKVKHPGEHTLVTSDNAVVEAAQARRMPVIKSETFGNRLKPRIEEETAATDDTPQVSEEEVAHWLDLFGPVPEREPAPKPPKKKKGKSKTRAAQRKKAFEQRDWSQAKNDDVKLSDEDVADWLDLFGSD